MKQLAAFLLLSLALVGTAFAQTGPKLPCQPYPSCLASDSKASPLEAQTKPTTRMMLPLVISAPAQQNSDSPYTYKGKTLGVTTFGEFTSSLTPKERDETGFYPECTSQNKGTRFCSFSEGLDMNVRFVDEKLAELDFFFNRDLYQDGYLKALTERFGAPAVKTSQYQNTMGATYTGRTWSWENSRGSVVLEEFGHGLCCATLTYYDKALLAEFHSRKEFKPEL
jgi:hypothetical protein